MVPALVEQVPLNAPGMNSQELSNSLWALKDFPSASPAVPKAVQALVQNVRSKIGRMKGHEMSGTVKAPVFAAESFPIDQQPDIISAAAERLNFMLPGLKGQDLKFTAPRVVWACGRSNVYNAKLFAAMAERFSSQHAVSSLPDWGLCALQLG